jgi:hypothetical protein
MGRRQTKGRADSADSAASAVSTGSPGRGTPARDADAADSGWAVELAAGGGGPEGGGGGGASAGSAVGLNGAAVIDGCASRGSGAGLTGAAVIGGGGAVIVSVGIAPWGWSSPPIAILKSRMPRPRARPASGRRFGPRKIKATTRMNRRCVGWRISPIPTVPSLAGGERRLDRNHRRRARAISRAIRLAALRVRLSPSRLGSYAVIAAATVSRLRSVGCIRTAGRGRRRPRRGRISTRPRAPRRVGASKEERVAGLDAGARVESTPLRERHAMHRTGYRKSRDHAASVWVDKAA